MVSYPDSAVFGEDSSFMMLWVDGGRVKLFRFEVGLIIVRGLAAEVVGLLETLLDLGLPSLKSTSSDLRML